jgi:D-glycero-alpha-D-manno-heptose 1-phosphate guanylyltransferase
MAENLADVTAAILAGGLGTRLRSRVADRPKVLAPVQGRPYLSYLLDQLAAARVRRVVLLTGYRAEQVRAAFGADYAGMRLVYSAEPAPLGTGGALRHALPYISSPTCLLLNGDSYCDVPLSAFWDFHARRAADASLVLTRQDDCSRFGRIHVAPNDRIARFEEKPQGGGPGWVNAGIYLIQRAVIEEILPDRPLSLERDLLPGWLDRRLLCAFVCRGRFLDIGTPESYSRAEALFRLDSRAAAPI